METLPHQPIELERIYGLRFDAAAAYRQKVWKTLIRHYFSPLIPSSGAVLDLGCGYGEFINQN